MGATTLDEQRAVGYATRYCAVLQRDVEVVVLRQPDKTWAPVRCTEKQRRCDGRECPICMRDARRATKSSWC